MSKIVLSREAVSALMNTTSNRVGSRVYCPDPAVRMELEQASLIRHGGGLTRAGSIVRQKHADQLMDGLFPL